MLNFLFFVGVFFFGGVVVTQAITTHHHHRKFLQSTTECGTAYGKDTTTIVNSHCFLDPPLNSDKWGWTNLVPNANVDVMATYTLYLGAADCDISKATVVGNVIVVYTADTRTLEIIYAASFGFSFGESHIWVGPTHLEVQEEDSSYVFAPGQWPHSGQSGLDFMYTITLTNDVDISSENQFYIAVHAKVFSDGFCPTSSSSSDNTDSPTTMQPTQSPTNNPSTVSPTQSPSTTSPTKNPTTTSPTNNPTTTSPTKNPTTRSPTRSPTTRSPTRAPTSCGTGYAKARNNAMAYCFLSYPITQYITSNNNWGWSNGLYTPRTEDYILDVYMGAAQCDTRKGVLVGTVIINYSLTGTLTVRYVIDSKYVVTVTHLYVGSFIVPKDNQNTYTVAPGQYPFNPNSPPTTYSGNNLYIIQLNNPLPAVYVIAHVGLCF